MRNIRILPLSCLFVFALILLFSAPLAAQYIFPSLNGSELLDSLEYYYKPSYTLGYDNARDYMFSTLDNHNDSVTCIYTDYRIYLNHNSSTPRQDAYAQDVNTEHTWPQSMGATGQAKSDLHHLFPSWTVANSDRGNDPFDEIPDSATDRWYRLNHYQSSIPSTNIDGYSEKDFDSGEFEPIEKRKGDVARAIFYFYTMYHSQANASFFEQQKNVLRQWHQQDPPDSREIQRTQMIASVQDGKPNPYVLDVTLVDRAFFGATAIEDPSPILPAEFQLKGAYPNPFNPTTRIEFVLPEGGLMNWQVYNIRGGLVRQGRQFFTAGEQYLQLKMADQASGIYIFSCHLNNRQLSTKLFLIK